MSLASKRCCLRSTGGAAAADSIKLGREGSCRLIASSRASMRVIRSVCCSKPFCISL